MSRRVTPETQAAAETAPVRPSAHRVPLESARAIAAANAAAGFPVPPNVQRVIDEADSAPVAPPAQEA